MQEITKEEIMTLIQLQKAETEIVRLENVLDDVEAEKAGLEKQLLTFEADVNQQREGLEAAARLCTETEAEIQALDDRIQKSNENLRRVKTNKEYQALQREVDDNRKRKDQLENEYIQYLGEKEASDAKVREKETELAQLTAKIRADQEKIHGKCEDDRNLLEEFRLQRDQIGTDLRQELLKLFDEISGSCGGLAVVEVKKEVCRGCFMNVPPQMYIEVQRCKTLITCPQCSRILYFGESIENTVGAG